MQTPRQDAECGECKAFCAGFGIRTRQNAPDLAENGRNALHSWTWENACSSDRRDLTACGILDTRAARTKRAQVNGVDHGRC
jgi:coenzyme F420-reducing hydrogenase beta subunit